MRFYIGQPPPTPDFAPQKEGWTALKEPSPWLLQLIATPVGMLTGFLLALGWSALSIRFELDFAGLGVLGAVAVLSASFVALIAVHEFLHAVGYRNLGLTESTIITFWPSKLLFLAITHDAYARNRMLLVYMLPLIVLSALPLALCWSLGIASAPIAIISIANGLAAGGDITCFFPILSQVPRNALVPLQVLIMG
jgi:hypothetical protein